MCVDSDVRVEVRVRCVSSEPERLFQMDCIHTVSNVLEGKQPDLPGTYSSDSGIGGRGDIKVLRVGVKERVAGSHMISFPYTRASAVDCRANT